MNKFTNLVKAQCFGRAFRFLEGHYQLAYMSMLVALGVEYLGISLYWPAHFPVWFGLMLFAVMLTAALWVSSNSAKFCRDANRGRREQTPPRYW